MSEICKSIYPTIIISRQGSYSNIFEHGKAFLFVSTALLKLHLINIIHVKALPYRRKYFFHTQSEYRRNVTKQIKKIKLIYTQQKLCLIFREIITVIVSDKLSMLNSFEKY